MGFAAGVNYGLSQAITAGYDYALLVNNDAFAAPNMLRALLNEAAPEIGLLSPIIYYEAEPQRIWFGNGRRINIEPGDTIVVPLDTQRVSKLQLWTNVTQILFNLSIAVAAVNSF